MITSRSSEPRSIVEAGRLLRNGSWTVAELTAASLAHARRLQPLLNSLITITSEYATSRAAVLDAELSTGTDRGVLHGIPIVHKDLIDTAAIRTTCGSRYFEQRVPSEDATVVTRLEQAGCVMIGKANLKELAAGGSGDNARFGPVRNPWDRSRSAGGSSSGSAVAIAAGICLGATGSDSGGSIRGPASWNGIVGIRPTQGLVSRRGCFARSYSFDCVGPMARTVADAALLLTAMAGHDARDPASVNRPREDYGKAIGRTVSGQRVGIVADFSFVDIEPAVASVMDTAIASLERLGVRVQAVQIPAITREFDYRTLFDILQYEFARILGPDYFACEDRDRMFGRFVHANMARGARVDDATYRRALESRTPAIRSIRSCFDDVDALLTPSQPFVAQPFDAPDEVFDRCRQFMLPFSFAGLPSISVPCGFDAGGLPVGLQLVCDLFEESRMISLADALAARMAQPERAPPL